MSAGALVRLYHFTHPLHLSKIEALGYIDVTESNLSRRVHHAGPDVVWLTDQGEPDVTALALYPDKAKVRITVEVPAAVAHAWLTWSREHGITRSWAQALERSRRPETWFVVTRRIPRSQWLAIDTLADVR